MLGRFFELVLASVLLGTVVAIMLTAKKFHFGFLMLVLLPVAFLLCENE